MSVQMLRNVIWTCFFTKPVCWQNSVVIFEKSYLPHMTSFWAELWSVDRYLSQESTKIEFALIGLLQLQILNFEWPKGQQWQNARFDFAGCDFHDPSLFIFLALHFQKGMDVSFLVPLESLHFDLQNSRSAQNID